MSTNLPFNDLEKVYEMVADAIDRVGPENESLFLAKFVMTLAHEINSLEAVEHALATALANLDNEKQE
jgi:hypothetical protein